MCSNEHPDMSGSGCDWEPEGEECETCEGIGSVVNDFDRLVKCPDCDGTGSIVPDNFAGFDDEAR